MKCDYISFAQKIIEGRCSTNNGKDIYHSTSFIYKTTNEDMQYYQKYLQDCNRALTVISSSEQIFNQVVEGTSNIDIFDISIFPYYYFTLKRAGILLFSEVNKYCDFFYGDIDVEGDDYYDDMYDEMRKFLDSDSKEFWDSLFSFYDWSDIYHSMLFSSEPYTLKRVVNRNKHLQPVEYLKLHDTISKVNFTPYIGDINQLASNLPSSYDIVNLSNISTYQSIVSYRKLLETIPLEENGQVLSYFYQIDDKVGDAFQELNPVYDVFPNHNGVMIYTKKASK